MTNPSRGHVRTWAIVGASLSACLSSACCWIPLLLLALGASTAGVLSIYEALRVPLLIVTGLLLGAGFFLVYSRRPRCSSAESCYSRDERLDKRALWLSTVLVPVFALLPNYVGVFFDTPRGLPVDGHAIQLEVRGMTCETCAHYIEERLLKVSGVVEASVAYAERRATVHVDPSSPPGAAALVEAVHEAGYDAIVDAGAIR